MVGAYLLTDLFSEWLHCQAKDAVWAQRPLRSVGVYLLDEKSATNSAARLFERQLYRETRDGWMCA